VGYARCVRVIVPCLALVASCYSPDFRDCMLACTAGVCPNGFECHDKMCRVPGATDSCLQDANVIESDALIDGSPDDDTDTDGVNDAIDNCRTVSNTDQLNEDMDEFGDACDLCPPFQIYSNNGNPNSDANVDSDGDGVGDGCDPFPTQSGERIRLFVGFSAMDPAPGSLQVGQTGGWTFAQGRAVATTSSNTLAAMLWDVPIQQGRRRFVSTHVAITAFQPSNMPRGAGVVEAYDVGSNQSAACVIGLDPPGAPQLMLLSTTLQTDSIVDQTQDLAGLGSGAPSDLVVNRMGAGSPDFSCVSRTTSVAGAPSITATGVRVGLRARGLTAEFNWFMVVDSTH